MTPTTGERRAPEDVGGRLARARGALRATLADPRLRRVQLAWSGTITAEWAIIVALGVWSFGAGGAVGVGLMTLGRTIPAALLGPFLAPFADRRPRDRVLAAVTLLRAVLVSGMAAALFGAAPSAVVYVLAALDATVYSLYWPAQSSLLVELARRPEDLVAANVASTTIENLGALAGPVFASAALSAAGPGTTVALGAALMVGSLAALRPWLRSTSPQKPHRDGAPSIGARASESGGEHRRLAGFRLLASAAHPRLVAGLYLAHTFALGGLTVLVVLLALDALGLPEPGVGLLTAGMGVGGVLGSLAALGLVGTPRLAGALVGGVLAWGAATGLLGLAPHAAGAVVLLTVGGIANALVDVAALTLLQRLVPAHLLGRVLGVVEGAWWAALGLGGFTASLLAAQLGVEVALAMVGAGLAAAAVAVIRSVAGVDAAAIYAVERVRVLLLDRILAPLPTAELERLAAAAVPVHVGPGEVVINVGDVGDRYYVIDKGSVEVLRSGVRIRLGPGDGFGELALLHDTPRNATVTAVEPTELLAVERSTFLDALRADPNSASAADEVATERLPSPGSVDHD